MREGFHPHFIQCVLCPERFSSVELLQQHNDSKHPYQPEDALSHALQTEKRPGGGMTTAKEKRGRRDDKLENVGAQEQTVGVSPSPGDSDSEEGGEELQEQRTRAREAALQFWERAMGKQVVLHLYENTTVRGILRALDAKQTAYLIAELATPIGTYPQALVRASDVMWMEVDGENVS
jgi:hypothetical protein